MLKDPYASGKNSWVCRVCGYHGKNSNVKRHIILKHAQHEHLPCPGCNQVLRNKEYFNVHVSTNHPELYESHKYSIANSKFYFWSLNVTKRNSWHLIFQEKIEMIVFCSTPNYCENLKIQTLCMYSTYQVVVLIREKMWHEIFNFCIQDVGIDTRLMRE